MKNWTLFSPQAIALGLAGAVSIGISQPAQAVTMNFGVDSVGAIADDATTDFTFTVSGMPDTTTDINLSLNLTHDDLFDLEIMLLAPGGTNAVLLAEFVLTGGNAMTNTVFDDAAAIDISSGTDPFTGSFLPIVSPTFPTSSVSVTPYFATNNLAQFNGINPNGTWTLRFDDLGPTFDGDLLSGTSLTVTAIPFNFSSTLGLLLLGGLGLLGWYRKQAKPIAKG
jgi:subtilisin-like proprotein convertase family protein